MNYDLITIGGGPAGYHAARLAAKQGYTVLLIENRNMSGGGSFGESVSSGDTPIVGGVCTHEGCIPTKTLLHSARLLQYVRRADRYGLVIHEASLDHRKVMARKRKTVKTIERGILAGLKKHGVTLTAGDALVTGTKGNDFHVAVGDREYLGHRLLIATGSSPSVPPLPGLEEGRRSGFIVTSREILEWEEIPGSLIVIGAGPVGLEFAAYFNALGVAVTVIEMLPRIGGTLDAEAAAFLQKELTAADIKFRLNSSVIGFGDGTVVVQGPSGKETIKAEKVLISVGRVPSGDRVGLAALGLKTCKGAVICDDAGRTEYEGVYAAGDVTGRTLLAHAAYRDAEAAVASMSGVRIRPHPEAVPAVMYTMPEAAWTGESEETAREKGIAYDAITVSFRQSGRFLIENEGRDGFFKMIVGKNNGRILGVHSVGDPSSEIIFGASLMIEREITLAEIRHMIFPHPTVSEIYHEIAHFR